MKILAADLHNYDFVIFSIIIILKMIIRHFWAHKISFLVYKYQLLNEIQVYLLNTFKLTPNLFI